MGKIAIVFAGQGAQYAGMGKSLYETSPAAKKVLDEAERLKPGTLSLCFEGTKEQLSRTLDTQPCLTAVDTACAAALAEAGVTPDGLAGFSLGEIPALAAGGMLPFSQAFKLAVVRAKLMQACAEATESGMTAVLKLADDAVEALCDEYGGYAVNYNCPGQVVCSLHTKDIPAFSEAVKAAGGRALPLAVNGGFHSPFMREAAEGLRAYAASLSFAEPRVPLYANASCRLYTAESAAALLGAQVESPVRWTELIRIMQADGFTAFVEVGAGRTLGGLMARIGGASVVTNVENAETLAETLRQLKGATEC